MGTQVKKRWKGSVGIDFKVPEESHIGKAAPFLLPACWPPFILFFIVFQVEKELQNLEVEPGFRGNGKELLAVHRWDDLLWKVVNVTLLGTEKLVTLKITPD